MSRIHEVEEQVFDGQTWLMGNLIIPRDEFLEMMPDYDGRFSVVVIHGDSVYSCDGIVPSFDFTYGLRSARVYLELSQRTAFAKRPLIDGKL